MQAWSTKRWRSSGIADFDGFCALSTQVSEDTAPAPAWRVGVPVCRPLAARLRDIRRRGCDCWALRFIA